MALFQCLPVRKIEQQVSWNQMNEKTVPVMFVKIPFKKSQCVNEPLFSWKNCDTPCFFVGANFSHSFRLFLLDPDMSRQAENTSE